MLRLRFSLISAAILTAALSTFAPNRAHAQLWTAVGDIADIIKSDGQRFNSDLAKIKSDYQKFMKARDLIDAQSARTADLHGQTLALIANLETEVTAFDNKRKGLKPEEWGKDDDAIRDRARYAALKKQIEGLKAFSTKELVNCIEAVKDAKKYTGTVGLSRDVGTTSGVDQGWNRVKDKVFTTIARCNEAAARVKVLEAENKQVILATPAEPIKIENTSDKMVFFVMNGNADGARIDPKSKVTVPMPADRVVRLRAEAQTPMREKILMLGKRGGKTITVQTATQHELTYTAAAGASASRTSTRVTRELCTWTVEPKNKVPPMTATPMPSKRYASLKNDTLAWTIPPITAATFSKGIREPLTTTVTCDLAWTYERTGSGEFGSKTEDTKESQYGVVKIWVMPQ